MISNEIHTAVAATLARYSTQGHLQLVAEDLKALRERATWYRTIVDRAPIGIIVTDRDGTIILSNPAFQEMVGYTADELEGRAYSDITHADEVPLQRRLVQRMLAGHPSGPPLDRRYARKDGMTVWLRMSVSALIDHAGSSHGFLAMHEDIMGQREIEEALRTSEARHLQMFEDNRAVQLLIEPDTGEIIDANPAACAFYGASREQMRATTIHAINVLSADIVAAEVARARREERNYFVYRHRLWSGEERDVEVHSSSVQIEGRPALFLIIHDITERKRVAEELAHQSLHDSLTGLPNRILLRDRLEQAILRSRREVRSLALLVLDVDGFREVNDTFGHELGDLVLQEVGSRMQRVVGGFSSPEHLVPPTVARLGGDEFAVILHYVDEQGAITMADTLLEAVRKPVLLGERQLRFSASVGIVLFPQHGKDASGLRQRADIAMHLAKQQHNAYVVYDADRDVYNPERHAIVGELRDALEQNGLHLNYQPEVTCLTGHTMRVEALIRWLHPSRGLISPADFIPMAERTGLIGPLTAWVLREALQTCAQWHAAGREVGVAINLSALSLSEPQLPETIERIGRTIGADFRWLDIEITESAIMADVERSMRVLHTLRDLGIRITADDFGTGYSSLTHLRRLPIDAVKIDRSFVVEMAVNEEDAIIVRSVIDLAHNLGLEVVAEGVEDRIAYDMLVAMGCEVAQGYFLSRPLPSDGITEWLSTE